MSAVEIREAVRAGGLLAADQTLVVLLSGGRDSVCLLDLAVELCGARAVHALHVNYGLREGADQDQRHCEALCERLAVELSVLPAGSAAAGVAPSAPAAQTPATRHPPSLPRRSPPDDEPAAGGQGNLQAWAREVRYAAAREIAERRGALIATGHTASDQVETILYRLAASPGRRALLGMAPREGSLVRPLLGLTREQTAAYCEARGLPWREDPSNEDERYARVRVRRAVLPALRGVHPAAEANVLRTARLLREETELLDALVAEQLSDGPSVAIARLEQLPPALARLVVVRLAEGAAGTYVPQAGERVAELIALARRGGRAELHVGGGTSAVVERGILRMVRLAPRGAPRGAGGGQ